ncbi:hypothetical protein GCM10023169_20490 [Georgenia halophila]|uniref:Uncharacterized protein n=1 Tax=Georgenia halophila TaxID=620889 RepID=A0ABP8L8C7_9MICO
MEEAPGREIFGRTLDLRLAWFLTACTAVILMETVNPATLSFVVVAVLNLVRVYRRSGEAQPRPASGSGLRPHGIS